MIKESLKISQELYKVIRILGRETESIIQITEDIFFYLSKA
jgi:hypothetical protein